MEPGTIRRVCIGSYCLLAPHKENGYRPYVLRHPILAGIGSFFLLAKGLLLLTATFAPDVAYLASISPSALIGDANAARKQTGLAPLKENALLAASARLKAQDMFAHQYFEHTSPSGITPWAWFDRAGYTYVYAGENLAIDFTTDSAVHAAWMASPGHRANILNTKYQEVGIAAVSGEFEGRTTTIVVQHFGSLGKAVAPAPAPLPTAVPSTPAPTARPVRPAPSEAHTPAPTLPTPQILVPQEGQILPSGASTVRGTSLSGTTVRVFLDRILAGTFLATNGTFSGTITPPENKEQEATLHAVASKDGYESVSSNPRRIALDTKAPELLANTAIFLPHTTADRTRELLLPLTGTVRSMTAAIGNITIPFTIEGGVAHAAVPETVASQPIRVRVTDEHGNTKTITVDPLLQYTVNPAIAGDTTTRAETKKFSDILTLFSRILLILLAVFLALHLTLSLRLRHGDLIAHAVFVLLLGGLLLFLT